MFVCGAAARGVLAREVAQLRVGFVQKKLLNPQYIAFFSSNGGGDSFRPRRRVPRSYRPLKSRRTKPKGPLADIHLHNTENDKFLLSDSGAIPITRPGVDPSSLIDPDDELDQEYGPDVAEFLRNKWRENKHGGPPDVESQLRALDYYTAPTGSTEDLVLERRAAMESWSAKQRKTFNAEVEKMIEEEHMKSMELGEDLIKSEVENQDHDDTDENSHQLAHGPWSETILQVDRVQKVIRGGTIVRYRTLVVGGNLNGVVGFGTGKAGSPREAITKAVRMCKRNIFFVDRYLGAGLTTDLIGKHNSCKVKLFAVPPNFGLGGNPICSLILQYAGICDAVSKSHGNRNKYNQVYATFKALMTHESMEEMALKRGKKLIHLERAQRLQI